MSRWSLVALALYTVVAVTLRRLVGIRRQRGWGYRFELVATLLRGVMLRAHAFYAAGPGVATASSGGPRGAGAGARGRGRRWQARAIPGVALERRTVGGRPAEVHTPAGWSEGAATLYYLHGGGYVAGSPATHRGLVGRIAVAAGVRCVVLDYRKAPDHPFPAAVDDAVAGYVELLAEGVEPGQLFVGGDSAGGGLTLATLLALRDAGRPLPRAAILLSPWVDLAEDPASVDEPGLDYLLPEMATTGAALYLQGADPRTPLASPLHAELSGLPPLLVQSGGVEMLLGQNRRLVERARLAGVEVSHDVAEGMIHVYQAFAALQPDGASAIERIGRFVRSHQA